MKQLHRRLLLGLTMATLFLGSSAQAQNRRPNVGAITRTINNCESRTDKFIGSLRHALNQANVRYERKDDLLQSAHSLEQSMDKVGDSWNRDKNPELTKQFVSQAISSASEINTIMVRRSLNPNTEQQWAQVRRDLNLLARAFDLPGLQR